MRPPILQFVDAALATWSRANPDREPDALRLSPRRLEQLRQSTREPEETADTLARSIRDEIFDAAGEPQVYSLSLVIVTDQGDDYMEATRLN